MSKRLKIFTALILAFQLLIPAFLLFYNKTIIDDTLKYGTEYVFRLEHLYSTMDFSDDEKYLIFFNIYSGNILLYVTEEISVDVNSEGFARISQRDDTASGRNWFSYKSYSKSTRISSDQFTAENGLSDRDVYLKLNQLKYNENYNIIDNAYVVARVYKGNFIPTAIYLEGEKLISISATS